MRGLAREKQHSEKEYLEYLSTGSRLRKNLGFKRRWEIALIQLSHGNLIRLGMVAYTCILTLVLLLDLIFHPDYQKLFLLIGGIGGLWLVFWLWQNNSPTLRINRSPWRLIFALIPLAACTLTYLWGGRIDLSILSYHYALMVYGGVFLSLEEFIVLTLAVMTIFTSQVMSDSSGSLTPAGIGNIIATLSTGWFAKGLSYLYFREVNMQSQLKFQYEHDELTGLYNRAHILNDLDLLIERTEPFTIVLADLHNYRALNQHFGPNIGDAVLRCYSDFCLDNRLPEWRVARYGADEIMIVLPGHSNVEQAVNKLREAQRRLVFETGTDSLPIYAEYGWASYPEEAETVNELIQIAVRQRMIQLTKTVHWEKDSGDVADLASGVRWNLFETLSAKDVYTRIHSESVATHLLHFCAFLGLDYAEKDLWRAGILHDIGKLAVPDRVLKKPGHLTREEYRIMMQHSQFGHDLIKHWVKNNPVVLACVHEHHERWDGTGYPEGKKGEEISLIGRIAAIVDAYSAMTLDRTYHRGRLPEEALEEIEKGTGTQFDPRLVKEFVTMIRSMKPHYLLEK